jgi:hypothetical protein
MQSLESLPQREATFIEPMECLAVSMDTCPGRMIWIPLSLATTEQTNWSTWPSSERFCVSHPATGIR